MSNSIDILSNPELQSKVEDPGKIGRLLNSFNKGVAFLPDALINNTPKAAAYIGDTILNRIPGIPDDSLESGLKNLNIPQDPIEKGLRAIGSIKDMPKAESWGDRFAESTGEALGGLVIPGGVAAVGEKAGKVGMALGRALLGTNKPVTSLSQLANPTFGSTVGGTAAQISLQPSIEETFPDSPIMQGALSLGAGLAGGIAGGAGTSIALGKQLQKPPLATAAQSADLSDPRTRTLIARQLDLTKKDPKSADILDKIATGQEASILNKLEPQAPISGGAIVDEITNSINNLKTQRSSEYQKAYADLMSKTNGKIDATPTFHLIGEIQQKTAVGSSLENALEKARSLIADNIDNPERLIDARRAIQDMTEMTGGLNLGSKQSTLLQKIITQLNKDIESSIPGYADMNETYFKQSKQLEELIDGVVGKVADQGVDRPSMVARQMFEKTDPALIEQLRGVLPEGVYDKAADLYLADIAKKGMQTPTKNTFNKINQFQNIGETLEKNRSTLAETLPERQNALVDEIIQDVDQTALGRPRNDYVIQSRRGVAVGDEVKGLGKISDMAGRAIGKVGGNYLQRQEMLTGVSPTDQIFQGVGDASGRAIQKGINADILAQPTSIPSPELTQEKISAPPLVINENKSTSFDDWMNKSAEGDAVASPSRKASNFNEWFDAIPDPMGNVQSGSVTQGTSIPKLDVPAANALDVYLTQKFGQNNSEPTDYSYDNKTAKAYLSSKNKAGKDVFKTTLQRNMDLLEKSGITGDRLNHFVAQLAHESGGFNHLNEIDPSKSNLSDKGGETYKGRGWIQLTGVKNYQRYGDELGIDLVNNPDLAADPDNALKIAVAYWNDHNLNDLADQDDIKGITRAINGGLNGFQDRKSWLNKVRSVGLEL
jgi:predicted chitinase